MNIGKQMIENLEKEKNKVVEYFVDMIKHGMFKLIKYHEYGAIIKIDGYIFDLEAYSDNGKEWYETDNRKYNNIIRLYVGMAGVNAIKKRAFEDNFLNKEAI